MAFVFLPFFFSFPFFLFSCGVADTFQSAPTTELMTSRSAEWLRSYCRVALKSFRLLLAQLKVRLTHGTNEIESEIKERKSRKGRAKNF
jgi:hypothetical protein